MMNLSLFVFITEILLGMADFIFVSRDFSQKHGYKSMTEAVEEFSKLVREG